jgi:alpha-beta hydrolase superfamily lysophospholipase
MFGLKKVVDFLNGRMEIPLPEENLEKSDNQKWKKGAYIFQKNNWKCQGDGGIGFIKSQDGTKLFYRMGKKREGKDVIFLVHGFGTSDHSGRLRELADHLYHLDFNVFSIDLRGQGHSEGARGHIENKTDYVYDILAGMEKIKEIFGISEVFLFGHSNGGLAVSHFALRYPHFIRGLILSSPMFEWAIKVPLLKKLPAHVLSKIWPTFSVPTGISADTLSHDPMAISDILGDPLIYTTASARYFTESSELMEEIKNSADKYKAPLLMLLAGEDLINDKEANKKWFEAYGGSGKTLKVYDGLYHEIFYELDRKLPIEDFGEWVKGQTGP